MWPSLVTFWGVLGGFGAFLVGFLVFWGCFWVILRIISGFWVVLMVFLGVF
jgi:hypothetical protein